MNFTFSDDQRNLRDAMHDFLVVETRPELQRKRWQTADGRPAELWQQFAVQGLTGLSVPEEAGGLGMGDLEWVLMAQELGYCAVDDSVVDTCWIAVALLRSLPTDHPLRARWLEKVAAGQARIAVGHALNPLVADAHVADLLLLDHAGELHAIAPQAAKLSANESMDLSRRLFRVEWQPDAATRVLAADAAAPLWQQALDRGALAAAAQMLGLSKRMLDLAIAYTADRKQFGKALGSFQAVKHLLADVAVKLEFGRPIAHRAAYALAQGRPAAVHVSHAKLAATEASNLAAKNCMQVHGAMGYTWEVDLQLYMKRAWALAGAWGDRGFHKARVSDAILNAGAPLGPGATFPD
jgi:alkylation response protein AidB-like acyl-CoA dehydrogenase